MKVIDMWLEQCKDWYEEQCEIIQNTTGESKLDHVQDFFLPLKQVIDSHPDDKFFFYGTEEVLSQGTYEMCFDLFKVDLNSPNTYWFWGIGQSLFFETMKIPPRWKKYHAKEQHFEFMRHMNKKLTELDKML